MVLAKLYSLMDHKFSEWDLYFCDTRRCILWIRFRSSICQQQTSSLPPSLPPLLPQLHDTGDIPRGEDPPDVVEVSNEDAAICSAGQSQGRQQLVALCLPITAGAGDAAATSISWRRTLNQCNIWFLLFPQNRLTSWDLISHYYMAMLNTQFWLVNCCIL